MDLFRNRNTSDTGRRRQFQEWIRGTLGLDPTIAVTIAELRCEEPGCPPVETVFGILASGDEQRKLKIHKPFADVTLEDLRSALAKRE